MHEENGAPIVEQVCDRYRIPRQYRDLAVLVTRYHGLAYKVIEQERKDPEDILSLFEYLDLFRRPERLQQFRFACLADVRGRPGFEDKPDRSEFLVKLFEAAKSVRAHDLGLTHLSGEEIKEAVRAARSIAISNMLI